MVVAVRAGESQRAVARRYRVSLSTVQFWVGRAADQPLERVDWSNRASGPHEPANRTPGALEDLILQVRDELRTQSDLGEYGAQAVQAELRAREVPAVPALSTLNAVFARRGVLDGNQRVRRRAPARGWYLPSVAAAHAELDLCDGIEDLKIKNGPLVDVLTVVSLHGGLVSAWPIAALSAQITRAMLVERWRLWGLPAYAQFDNDTRFQGPHQHADVISSVMRLCLSLGVTPVFVPPRETGFQAAIEGFNGLWQAKVWSRFQHPSLLALQAQSARYVAAHQQRTLQRRAQAPTRRDFPASWTLNLQTPPHGQVIFLRRSNASGEVTFLGHSFLVSDGWLHRLVRCEVDLDHQRIRFYTLRRRAPDEQRLLTALPYTLPNRHFRE